MKKSKRMISLVLALIMVFCFMAVSASAATTEVQPRGTCPSCIYGYMETIYGSYTSSNPDGILHTGCGGTAVGHEHYIRTFPYAYTLCRNCGYTGDIPGTLTRYYCPHTDRYVS